MRQLTASGRQLECTLMVSSMELPSLTMVSLSLKRVMAKCFPLLRLNTLIS